MNPWQTAAGVCEGVWRQSEVQHMAVLSCS